MGRGIVCTRTHHANRFHPNIHEPGMATQTLHGSCACGRNRYVIEMPTQQIRQAELRYDNTSASRKYTPSVVHKSALGCRALLSNTVLTRL